MIADYNDIQCGGQHERAVLCSARQIAQVRLYGILYLGGVSSLNPISYVLKLDNLIIVFFFTEYNLIIVIQQG